MTSGMFSSRQDILKITPDSFDCRKYSLGCSCHTSSYHVCALSSALPVADCPPGWQSLVVSSADWMHQYVRPPNILLALPCEPVREILTDWLCLMSIVGLDSAFCCKRGRETYQDLAYNLIYSIRSIERELARTVIMSNPAVNWYMKRGLKLDGVTVTKDLADDKIIQRSFFSAQGSSINWLQFDPTVYRCRVGHIDIMRFCPNLKELTIHVVKYSSHVIKWEEVLLACGQSCTQLHSLAIRHAPCSSQGLVEALGHYRSLKKLTLELPWLKLPIEVTLPTLTYLDISRSQVSDEVALAIAAHCPNLQTLLIFADNAITDAVVQAVLQGCRLLGRTDVELARRLSDGTRLQLVQRYSLRLFEAEQWNSAIANEVLKASPELTELHGHCGRLTDTLLEVCAQYCPKLELLNISACSRVTTAGIIALITAAKYLRVLNLFKNPQLDVEQVVIAIAQHCPLLRELACGQKISEAGRMALRHGCPHLEGVLAQHEGGYVVFQRIR